MIHLPATERTTITAALAVAESRDDKTDAMRLYQSILAWLRAEITSAKPEVITRALNQTIITAKEIIE